MKGLFDAVAAGYRRRVAKANLILTSAVLDVSIVARTRDC